MFSKIRKLIFWVSVASYFIIAPLIIMYAFGYKWKYGETTLRETGIISIKSYPEKADIFLNNAIYDSKTPSWIQGLSANSYNIKVEKDGFFDWEKTLNVKPGMVTRAENILLVPKRIAARPILEDAELIDFIATRNTKEIIMLADLGNKRYGFYSFSGNDEPPKLIPVKIEKTFNIEVFKNLKFNSLSKGSAFLLADIASPKEYLAVNFDSGEIIEVNKKFNIAPSEIKWSETQEEVLYFIQNGFMGRINLNTEEKFISEFKASSFDLAGDRIYIFNKNDNSISFLDSNLKEISIINSGDYFTELLFKKSDSCNYRIFVAKNILNMFRDNTAVLLSDTGDLFITKPPYFLDASVKSVVFSDDGSRIIYCAKDKMLDYNLKPEEEIKDIYFSPIPQKKEVLISREGIDSVYFFMDNFHVIFNDGRSIVITELGGMGRRNSYYIYKRSINEKFYFSNSDERLYFIDLDKKSNKKNLFRIDFYKDKRT